MLKVTEAADVPMYDPDLEACPRCGSDQVTWDEDGEAWWNECPACGWRSR